MMIVAVFDPLALVLILAAQQSIRWARGEDQEEQEPVKEIDSTFTSPIDNLEPVFDREEIPLDEPEPIIPHKKEQILAGLDSMWNRAKSFIKQDPETEHAPVETLVIDHDDLGGVDDADKEARRAWKAANPNDTIKHQERLLELKKINVLPWQQDSYLGLQADNSPDGPIGQVRGFGTSFPEDAIKGDMFLRVDRLPSGLYKYNGTMWIEVDKSLSDSHAWNDAYIDHLIAKIGTGEYDPELLSDAERDRIEAKLKSDPPAV
jgi:hypothetical protein